MIRRVLKYAAAAFGVLLVAAAGVYLAGGRLELDGGGGIHLRFPESAAEQARAIEAHREAQRRALDASPGAVAAPAAAVPAAGTTGPDGPGTASPATTASWPGFRGAERDGTYRDRPILASWPPDGLKPIWKQPAGAGYASFAVANGVAFTIEQRGPKEVVAAYDVKTGRELWTNSWDAEFSETMGGDGPRATPAWSDGIVYALGALGELRSLDAATGRVVWRTNILDAAGAENLQWGVSASPLVVDNTVVVLPGGPGGKSVAAYDKRSGAKVWSALDDKQAYSSPMLATIGGERQLLVFSAERLMGLSPANGAVRWEYPWTTQYDVNAAQPVVLGSNRVFVSSGYGTGAAVIEIAAQGGAFAVREIWKNIRMKNQFSTSVLHNGFLYGLDESILACIDAATGELKWKGGRYGYGQILLAGDRIVVLTEQGDLALVQATPDGHRELGRFAALEGKTWNHPVLVDGVLLIRNLREMAAFDLNRRNP